MSILLSQLVDRAAEKLSDRVAFSDPSTGITFGELAMESSQLAHLLVDEGVERGDRVGILLPRCAETAVAVYGVLKAGAAFVPIDPLMPAQRVREIIENCGIRHLITSEKQRKALVNLVASPGRLECVIGYVMEGSELRFHSWGDWQGAPGMKT